MNDSKGTYLPVEKVEDSGIQCSEIPAILASPIPHTYGPGFRRETRPDPLSSNNYLKR